jgi:hypothetical protein
MSASSFPLSSSSNYSNKADAMFSENLQELTVSNNCMTLIWVSRNIHCQLFRTNMLMKNLPLLEKLVTSINQMRNTFTNELEPLTVADWSN